MTGGLRKPVVASSMAPGVFGMAVALPRGLGLKMGGQGDDACGERFGDSKLAGDFKPARMSMGSSANLLSNANWHAINRAVYRAA